jgi:hypothetical protein
LDADSHSIETCSKPEAPLAADYQRRLVPIKDLPDACPWNRRKPGAFLHYLCAPDTQPGANPARRDNLP